MLKDLLVVRVTQEIPLALIGSYIFIFTVYHSRSKQRTDQRVLRTVFVSSLIVLGRILRHFCNAMFCFRFPLCSSKTLKKCLTTRPRTKKQDTKSVFKISRGGGYGSFFLVQYDILDMAKRRWNLTPFLFIRFHRISMSSFIV